MNRRFPEYFWGILTLALATVVAAFVIGSALRQFRGSQDVITVTGSARRPIRSDFVVWRCAVASQQPTMQTAYQDVQRYSERVRAYLRDAGIPDSVITQPALDTEQIPEFLSSGQPSGRIAAYRLQQRFEVRSNQVDPIATLARKSSELITEGIPTDVVFARVSLYETGRGTRRYAGRGNNGREDARHSDCRGGRFSSSHPA